MSSFAITSFRRIGSRWPGCVRDSGSEYWQRHQVSANGDVDRDEGGGGNGREQVRLREAV